MYKNYMKGIHKHILYKYRQCTNLCSRLPLHFNLLFYEKNYII
jgi:hypothetical protein